jgi:hypothetical protein
VVGGLSDPLYLSNNIGEPTPKNERLALTNKLLRFLETHNSSPRIGPTFIVLEVGPPPQLHTGAGEVEGTLMRKSNTKLLNGGW